MKLAELKKIAMQNPEVAAEYAAIKPARDAVRDLTQAQMADLIIHWAELHPGEDGTGQAALSVVMDVAEQFGLRYLN